MNCGYCQACRVCLAEIEQILHVVEPDVRKETRSLAVVANAYSRFIADVIEAWQPIHEAAPKFPIALNRITVKGCIVLKVLTGLQRQCSGERRHLGCGYRSLAALMHD